MKSILENRSALAKEVDKVAEVAGYLWQKGWAERNGGNITINITEYVDDEIKAMPAISEVKPIGATLPYLKGCYFYCKGTNKRMRDLARWPMENGSVIRILDDCASYVIIADEAVVPTSELPSHLSVHNDLLSKNSPYKASVHTHPIELIAMTHCEKFLQKDVATNLLWSMIPETKAFCPRGLGIVPYKMPSSVELADTTLKELDDYDVMEEEIYRWLFKTIDELPPRCKKIFLLHLDGKKQRDGGNVSFWGFKIKKNQFYFTHFYSLPVFIVNSLLPNKRSFNLVESL